MATSEATRKEEQHGIRPRTSAAARPKGTRDQAGRLRPQRGRGVEAAGARRVERKRGAVTSQRLRLALRDRKSTRLNSSHVEISYAVFCLKKKKQYSLHHSGPERAEKRYRGV